MKDCQTFEASLYLLTTGDLDAHSKAEVISHMEQCAACAEIHEQLTAIAQDLHKMAAEPPILSAAKSSPCLWKRSHGAILSLARCTTAILFIGLTWMGFESWTAKTSSDLSKSPLDSAWQTADISPSNLWHAANVDHSLFRINRSPGNVPLSDDLASSCSSTGLIRLSSFNLYDRKISILQ